MRIRAVTNNQLMKYRFRVGGEMNDRFLFRAMKLDPLCIGELWQYGSYLKVKGLEHNPEDKNVRHYIIGKWGEKHEIAENTLGQSVAIKDKNKKMMFESDIYELKVVGIHTHIEYINCLIEWNKSVCALGWKRITEDSDQVRWQKIINRDILDKKFLGNMHEKPELLNV